MLHLVIILFHLIPSSSVVEFQCFSISFFLSPFVPHSILLSLSHSLFLIMAIFALLLGLIHPELCVSPAKKLMHIISDPSSLFGAHSSPRPEPCHLWDMHTEGAAALISVSLHITLLYFSIVLCLALSSLKSLFISRVRKLKPVKKAFSLPISSQFLKLCKIDTRKK